MKGSYSVAYKHPKEKVLSDQAFDAALIVAVGIALISIMGKTTTTSSNTGKFTTPLSGEIWAGSAIGGYTVTRVPDVNYDVTTSTTTEGGAASALGSLATTIIDNASAGIPLAASGQNNLHSDAQVVALIGAITSGIFYFYQGVDVMLDILYKLVPYRDYVFQFDSHAFYNNFAKVTNPQAPVINKSITRSISSSKYITNGIQDFDAQYRINNLYRNKLFAVKLNNTLPNPSSSTDQTKQTASQYGINVEINADTVAYYGALKLDYQNQYGQLTSIIQVPTDSCVFLSKPKKDIPTYTGIVFGGDIYINRYTEKNIYPFFNTWMYDLPDGMSFDYNLYYNGPRPRYRARFRHFAASDFDVHLNTEYGIDDLLSLSLPISWTTPSDFYYLDTYGEQSLVQFTAKNQAMYLFNNGVRDFFTESELNMAFRDYGENEWEKFYDVYGNSFSDLNTMFRSDIITKPIYYKYDLSLSTTKLYTNFSSWGSILPPDYDPVLYDTCYQYFPYRGIYSLQQQDGLKRDNWRNFLPLNYYTFEGVVTNIKSVNSNGALILYEDFSPSQFVGVDTLKTEAGTKVTIGDGGLFANNIQSLANAEDVIDYGASISNRATLNTPYGLFFVSQKAGKVVQYGSEGLQEISKAGMKNWFLQNLPSELLKQFPNFTEYDNPVSGIAVQSIYDAQYELLYITKKDYKPKACVGYTPEIGFFDKCNCPNGCPTGYTMMPDGKCQKITDVPICNDASLTFNPVTGKCEGITRTPADCGTVPCKNIEIYPPVLSTGSHTITYINCSGVSQNLSIANGGTMVTICTRGITSDNLNGLTNPLYTTCI